MIVNITIHNKIMNIRQVMDQNIHQVKDQDILQVMDQDILQAMDQDILQAMDQDILQVMDPKIQYPHLEDTIPKKNHHIHHNIPILIQNSVCQNPKIHILLNNRHLKTISEDM